MLTLTYKINRPQRMLKHPAALTNYLAVKEQGIMADSQLTFTLENSQSATPVEYRTLDRFPGYRFGSDGTIWSFRKGSKWKMLKLTKATRYFNVSLSTGFREQLTFNVHPVMCEAFHGPKPSGMECRHIDGNVANNRPENLAWGTHSQNQMDKHAHGTMNCGESHYRAKLNAKDVAEIRSGISAGSSDSELAIRFGVSKSSIQHIKHGRHWANRDVEMAERCEGVKRRELRR